MGDVPADYLADVLANIVGIKVPIKRMTGKWKSSQNRVTADREGVVVGLRTTGEPADAAIAELVQEALSRA